MRSWKALLLLHKGWNKQTNKKPEAPLPGSAYHPLSQYSQLCGGQEQALKEKDGWNNSCMKDHVFYMYLYADNEIQENIKPINQ